MRKRTKISILAVGLTLITGQAIASDLVKANCAECHQSDGNTIWGTIVAGSQNDAAVEVTTGTKT